MTTESTDFTRRTLMTQPCEQEQSIKHITSTLDRMEKGFDKLIELLQAVAKQDTRISHLEIEGNKLYTDVNKLAGRIRTIELDYAKEETSEHTQDKFEERLDALDIKLDRLITFFKITTHKYAVTAYAFILMMIMVGFINDIIYHNTVVTYIFNWVRKVF